MDTPEILTSISDECQRGECDQCLAFGGQSVFCVHLCHKASDGAEGRLNKISMFPNAGTVTSSSSLPFGCSVICSFEHSDSARVAVEAARVVSQKRGPNFL